MQKQKDQSLGCWGSTTAHLGLFEQGLDVPLFLGPFLCSDFFLTHHYID